MRFECVVEVNKEAFNKMEDLWGGVETAMPPGFIQAVKRGRPYRVTVEPLASSADEPVLVSLGKAGLFRFPSQEKFAGFLAAWEAHCKKAQKAGEAIMPGPPDAELYGGARLGHLAAHLDYWTRRDLQEALAKKA